MYKIFAAVSLTILSSLSHAECAATGCDQVTIDLLYVTASGTVYIGTSGDETKMLCKAESSVFSTLSLSQPGANAIYSLLLAAQTTNKPVYIRTDESNPSIAKGCNIFYVTMNRY
jgi:hypothetical protein